LGIPIGLGTLGATGYGLYKYFNQGTAQIYPSILNDFQKTTEAPSPSPPSPQKNARAFLTFFQNF
jgi:hypothetical protein